MKKMIFLLLLSFAAGRAAAQKIKVEEGNESIGGGRNNAFSVTIYYADPSDIEKEWKSLIKGYDPDKVSSKDGIFADNAKMKSISDNTVDVYAKTDKVREGETRLIVAVDMGGAFLNSSKHGSGAKEIRNLLHDLAVKLTTEALEEQVKDMEKVLAKMDSKQKDLIKDQENLKKDIENYKARIKKAEDDIVKNTSDQEAKAAEIAAQKKLIEETKSKKAGVE